ncbi:ATP-binding protein [uncultured Amnibacterium sp.]|uniref:ATP-binding protein n=1 Tax=uncultured Amnibacterium sp. TaxID=1631851 RepID=UPI0035C987C3
MREIDERVSEFVRVLRARGRDFSSVEVTAAVGGVPKSLPETISAFANTSGGTILLGLKEGDGFRPADGFDANRVEAQVADLLRQRGTRDVQGPVHPVPPSKVETAEFEGAFVVVIDIDELAPESKPCFVSAQGMELGSYERIFDGDHRMGSHAVFLLSSNRTQPLRDVESVPGSSVDDFDPALLDRYIQRVRTTRPRLSDVAGTDDALLRLVKAVGEDGHATFAGLLALGRYPQQFFPQLMISLSVFPGPTKDALADGTRMLDRATLEGPVPTMVADALIRIARNLSTRRVASGALSADHPEIPLDAVREALVNALAHRDYSSFAESEQVRVELYSNRLEIVSPGGIWGGRTERELFDGGSRSRNATLTRLLEDVPTGRSDQMVSENAGVGLRLMVGSMKQRGLPVPSLTARPTFFSALLSRHGLLDPGTIEWLAGIGASALDERSRAVLALVSTGRKIDDQTVRAQLDMDSFDALTLMRTLARDGWLSEGRNGRFLAGPRATGQLPLEVPSVESLRADPLLALLGGGTEMSIQELARETGIGLSTLRYRLRGMVERGQIVATAPPTSRNRRYRLA